MHEARVLCVLGMASRDVHRIRTYEIDVQRVETGWKQPVYIRKGAGRVLRLARSQHMSLFNMNLVCGVSALCSLVSTSRCTLSMLQNSHPNVRHFVKASPNLLGG